MLNANVLHRSLRAAVEGWRRAGHPCEFPAVAEILRFARDERGERRHLRAAQLEALETYWYLRAALDTPRVIDLYRRMFAPPEALLGALGIDPRLAGAGSPDELLARIASGADGARTLDLASLRETLALAYPSYLFALAMGAGKTLLIGAILASELALAQEYPGGPFARNALVFAPGKTILESLRELVRAPYQQILPARLWRRLAASLKITLARDGAPELPVIAGSSFNVVVTNSEKIRIHKDGARDREVANRRLQTLATLPALAVFADEAHHTYGPSLADGLKRIRQTVDFLAAATRVICVVNTTGTPYHRRRLLHDVVFWYGLGEAIEDGVLKSVSNNIRAYDPGADAATLVAHVIEDFCRDYGTVRLPDGAPARLALYFPQTKDLRALRPAIDAALARAGLGPEACLTNTSDARLTTPADLEAFRRLNDPAATARVILLVNKGTEGWNCPSLFACGLLRTLKDSHNFVLQAATRCLRQVPGNERPARIYLARENLAALERQLVAVYGETMASLAPRVARTAPVIAPAADTSTPVLPRPPRPSRAPSRRGRVTGALGLHLRLRRPHSREAIASTTFTLEESGTLRPTTSTQLAAPSNDGPGRYAVAVELCARYGLDVWLVLDELARLYGDDPIAPAHVTDLARQIEEAQVCSAPT